MHEKQVLAKQLELVVQPKYWLLIASIGDNPHDAPRGRVTVILEVYLSCFHDASHSSMTPFTDLRNERESQTPDTMNLKKY